MSIPVSCQCGQRFSAKPALAGKTVKCPKCGAALKIPSPAAGDLLDELELEPLGPPPGPPVQPPPAAPRGVADLLAEEGVGAKRPGAALSAGGKLCPGCQQVVPQATVLCVDCGYNFILGKQMETRVGGRGPQQPALLDSDNPYASPAEAPVSPGLKRRRRPDSGRRDGPPWEQDIGLLAQFFGTVLQIVAAPHRAFATMSLDGGMWAPISFNIVATLILGVLLMLLISGLLLLGISILPLPTQFGVNQLAAFGLGMLCLTVGYLGCLAAALAIILPIVLLFQTAFLHLGLLIVGGANESFEVSYRVRGYVMGALILPLAIPNMVPILGPLLLLIVETIYISIGQKFAHETSWGQAIAGTLIGQAIMAGIGIVVYMNWLSHYPAFYCPW